MAYGDQKQRHVRSSGWTKEDQRKEEAQRRREQKAREKHLAWLASLTPGQRAEWDAKQHAAQIAQQEAHQQLQKQYEAQHQERIAVQVADVNLMAGYLTTEVATAVKRHERYDLYDGEWLEDPVDAMTINKGFAEEYNKPHGVRMMVNLCLDSSNSMRHNNLATVSLQTLKQMWVMLRLVERDLPAGMLQTNVWFWARYEDGKGAYQRLDAHDPVDTMERGIEVLSSASFNGEDTWIAPLFKRIEAWENDSDAQSYHRLDIVITDGVLEHPTDIREASEVQMRRNGSLQTDMFNFLPSEEWGDFPVPKRCVQYEANPDNLLPLMRQVFGDWVTRI
jgi:hypothetical protein